MQYWLMKSEPSCYSIDDFARDTVEPWDGVRNYQARNMMRDDMRKGDKMLFYHSNAKEIGVVGEGKIASDAYPDPTQFDPKADHYDPTATKENPRWYLVDVKFVRKFSRIVTLAEIKNDPKLKSMAVAQKGNRLSVQPVSKEHFDKVVTLGLK